MFDSKQKTLFKNNNTSANAFIKEGNKKSAETKSGNGALKYSTTGNPFVDQFSFLGSYKKPREYGEIAKDMSKLWASNPYYTICLTIFIRLITRVVQLFDGSKFSSPQRGAGLRHEGIFRMMWIAVNHPDSFWKNINLFISAGSWKDVITMLSYDLQYNDWKGRKLDWDKFGKLILAGLENPNTSELIKKYLPSIKSNSNCRTLEAQADNLIAKFICSLLFGNKGEDSGHTYKKYRKLKTSGTAHEWQKLISKKNMGLINFDTVHGRALASLVSGKFIENNGLQEAYEKWISSRPIAKFTGYPHELFEKDIPKKKYQIDTINSQFKGLVETAKKSIDQNTSLIVVRDTSGSMGSTAIGTKMTCHNIGKALALFFSEMLPKGHFANSWIEFNNGAKMHNWQGSTPVEKWVNDKSTYTGTTNFQAVIDLFIDIKNKGVAESEFPTGLLCISDGEFNPSNGNCKPQTNASKVLEKLRMAGFSPEFVNNFKMIFWDLQSNAYGNSTGKKFESFGNTKNVFYFSGYDGAIISFLTGKEEQDKKTPQTAEELFLSAIDQDIMKLVEV